MQTQTRPLAVVTGASTGIGFELAKLCGARGFDLVIAADEPEIEGAAAPMKAMGASVDVIEADLATTDGVDRLVDAIGERPVEVLVANVGRGLGHAFLDQSWNDVRRVIDTNVTGTLYLIHRIGRRMREQRRGRILVVGSIAGVMPGTFQAVYNGTKALLDSFAVALRAELEGSGVTVTCLMPGPTETAFFERAGLLDTKLGTQKKQPAVEVARQGFDAMMRGEREVVTGWQNKVQFALAHVTPSGLLARLHRMKTAPGTGKARRRRGPEERAGRGVVRGS